MLLRFSPRREWCLAHDQPDRPLGSSTSLWPARPAWLIRTAVHLRHCALAELRSREIDELEIVRAFTSVRLVPVKIQQLAYSRSAPAELGSSARTSPSHMCSGALLRALAGLNSVAQVYYGGATRMGPANSAADRERGYGCYPDCDTQELCPSCYIMAKEKPNKLLLIH